jgi:YbbR domain-containing protein
MTRPLRWLVENGSTLLMAFVLAITVWVAAVNAADPIAERAFSSAIPIAYEGLSNGLLMVGTPPTQGLVSVRAPASVWNQLTPERIHLRVDLRDQAAGRHDVSVAGSVDLSPARLTSIDPAHITLTIEPAASKDVTARVVAVGEPALGYRAGEAAITPAHANVSGPASLVAQVKETIATADMTNRRGDLAAQLNLAAVDSSGQIVPGVTINPETAGVMIPVNELVGYRLVAVIPIIQGQVDAGYQVTNIALTPTLVTVFSPDPQAVEALPGYVETLPISLAGAHDTLEERVSLALPKGIFLAGTQNVLVQVSISPIEISTTIARRPELQGLRPGLYAEASPNSISVILKGPLPVLEQLKADDVRVILDLTGLGPGAHQLAPVVLILPAGVVSQSVLPDTIEVIITTTPPPQPTPTP